MRRSLGLLLLICAVGLAQKAPTLPGTDPAVAGPAAPGPAAPGPATQGGRGGTAVAPEAPGSGRGRGATAAPATAPGPKDLKYPPARTVQIPAFTTFTLPNGMKVCLLEDHELPVVTGSVLVRTGSLFDPPERIGLAQLTGTLLRAGGTALKTGEQLDDMLEALGAVIDSSIGESQGTVTFITLKENTDRVLVLLKEMLTQPGFRSEKLESTRGQVRTAVGHRNDSPETITTREMRGLVYGKDTPFGWDAQYGTLDRITRGDVRNFYQRYFFPANLIFGVQGDFDSGKMKATLEAMFADWTVQQKPVPEFPKVKIAPSPGIFLAEKKDATQATFTIGHLGGQHRDKDSAALEIATFILGGPRGRLVERSRVKMGSPSEIRVTWGVAPDHQGLFQLTGSTRSISILETIKIVQEELERLRTAEVTEDELRLARETAMAKAIAETDSKAKIFSTLLGFEYYGYPKDYIQERQKALLAVTRADILRAAKASIVPANLTIVVSGSPMLFGDSLERLGPVTKLDITIPQPKGELAESTDTSLAQGKQMLQKAQAAIGGADRLAAVRDYSMVAQYQIDPAIQSLGGSKITQTDRWVSPTVFRQDSVLPSGAVAAYTDGKIGWIYTPQGWGALAGSQAKQVFGDLFRIYFRLFLSDRLEGRTINAIDDTTLQISDATGQVCSVEIDTQTGLPRKISYDTPQAAGPPIYTEEVYEDFRDIAGIKIPFKFAINQAGRKFADVVVNEYKMNAGIKPAELAKRPQ
ncbi:MAG: peptidase domain protein [Candidatus Solibacter sp.]|nr:peptidase domain protein [Candidatus Solibacter sp.]